MKTSVREIFNWRIQREDDEEFPVGPDRGVIAAVHRSTEVNIEEHTI